MPLNNESCQPLRGSEHRISSDQATELLQQIPQWEIDPQGRLRRRYSFSDFMAALAFTNQLAEVAEAQGHHPDLELGWGYVVVHLVTHDVGGLSRNDFILAARIDALASG